MQFKNRLVRIFRHLPQVMGNYVILMIFSAVWQFAPDSGTVFEGEFT